MSSATVTVRRAWHPVVGATLVVLPALAALTLAALSLASRAGAETAAGLTAFLAMGAVAGFAVSGST